MKLKAEFVFNIESGRKGNVLFFSLTHKLRQKNLPYKKFNHYEYLKLLKISYLYYFIICKNVFNKKK
jgi:hypothetical protein